jgi:hypothetical protein
MSESPLISWRYQRGSNPRFRRERARVASGGGAKFLEESAPVEHSNGYPFNVASAEVQDKSRQG